MSSEAPLGHGGRLAGLWRAAAEGRLAHALLVTGPEGIGKFQSLTWLARGLLCAAGPGPPCLECGPCKRSGTGNHADLFIVDAAAVGQDQITIFFVAHRDERPTGAYAGPSIEDFLTLRAHEGGWRVVLVREAERMNENAQNALLKSLEEPTAQTLLALETSAPGQLLETVRSRVVPVALAPLSVAETRSVLADHGLGADEATRLARWSGGAPGRALALRELGAAEMLAILAKAFAGDVGARETADAVWQVDGRFQGKTPSAQARARVRVFLDLGLDLLADHARAAAGLPPERLAHGELLARVPADELALAERRMEQWLAARQDVPLNMSPEAILDRALLSLDAHRKEGAR